MFAMDGMNRGLPQMLAVPPRARHSEEQKGDEESAFRVRRQSFALQGLKPAWLACGFLSDRKVRPPKAAVCNERVPGREVAAAENVRYSRARWDFAGAW